ncbi:unnamed protein product [Urochloa humidicola]
MKVVALGLLFKIGKRIETSLNGNLREIRGLTRSTPDAPKQGKIAAAVFAAGEGKSVRFHHAANTGSNRAMHYRRRVLDEGGNSRV